MTSDGKNYLQGLATGVAVGLAVAALWSLGSERRARAQVRAAFEEAHEQMRNLFREAPSWPGSSLAPREVRE